MVSHPIHVKRNAYRGSDAKKRLKASTENRTAMQLETYINELLKAQVAPVQVYGYQEISSGTGVDYEVVRNLCFSIDCGNGGFTAIRNGLTVDQALDLAAKGEVG